MGWVFLAILVVCLALAVGVYNNLVRARNQVANQFADIDVVLTKRYDLIPNLVAVAKKYMQHEADTLTSVTQARNAAASALAQAHASGGREGLAALAQAENSLTSALGGLQVVFEAYPDLKADAQMRQLQADIGDMENQVMAARSVYNQSVTDYNNLAQAFPNNVLSAMFAFKPAQWLELEEMETKRQAVQVKFD